MFKQTIALLLVSFAIAKQTGAPFCIDVDNFNVGAHGKANKSLKYDIKIDSSKPKVTIEIDKLAGLVAYIVDSKGNKVGTFGEIGSDFKKITSGCVTHTNPAGKDATLEWSSTADGKYKLKAVVMENPSSWNSFTVDFDYKAEPIAISALGEDETENAPQEGEYETENAPQEGEYETENAPKSEPKNSKKAKKCRENRYK